MWFIPPQLKQMNALAEMTQKTTSEQAQMQQAIGAKLAEMQAMRKTGTAFESWEDQKGRTLLYFAVFLEKEDVVRYLVGDLKSDVNHVDRIGGTPLTKAIWTGNFKLCNFLCRNGADVLQRDHYGNTPLIIAALMGDLNIAKLLVDHGAHLKDTNHRGKRA